MWLSWEARSNSLERVTQQAQCLLPNWRLIPPPQRGLWEELRHTPKHFVLYEGTALALRLAHRSSEDFDFFSNDPFAPDSSRKAIPYLHDAEMSQSEPNTLTANRCVFLAEQPCRNIGPRTAHRALPLCHAGLESLQSRGLASIWAFSWEPPDVPASLSIDVGVDTHDFRPWHFDEVSARMAEKLKDRLSAENASTLSTPD